MPSHLVAFMIRHPVGVVLAAVLAAVLALLYTAMHLAFDSNRLDLISAGEHYKALDAAYGSYFIARFEEEQAATSGMPQALVRTFATTGPGIVATALTTAFTFGTLLLPGFKGIAELGVIGGSSILLTLLATFTVLPVLLVWHERHGRVPATSQTRPRAGDRGGHLAILYRYPRASLAAGGLLVGPSCVFIGRVGADFNLLHLQARGTESVMWEQKIFESTKESSLFAELAADSLAEVERKVAALKALPSVAKVESIMSVIPEDQAQKLPVLEGLRPLLAEISFQGGWPRPWT
jgi:uncharacterized protein